MERGEPIEETPELSELLQQDPATLSVPVRMKGSITGYRLPNRRVQYSTDVVGADWVPLLPATPKRGKAVLIADQPFFVSVSGMGGGMLIPAGVPYVATHTEAIHVRSAGGVGPYAFREVRAIADPAAGAVFSLTVPAGEAWRVRSVRYRLTTSAVVGSRIPEVVASSGGAVFFSVSTSGPLAASNGGDYQFADVTTGNNNTKAASIPGDGLLLAAGEQLAARVIAIDPADQISQIVVVLEVATVGRATVGTSAELWAD